MKRCPSTIREMQTKTPLKFHLTTVRMPDIQTNNRFWPGRGEKRTLVHCRRSANLSSLRGNDYGGSWTRMRAILWPGYTTPRHFTKGLREHTTEMPAHTQVYYRALLNCQATESARWRNCMCANGISFSREEWHYVSRWEMDATGDCHVKWSKLARKMNTVLVSVHCCEETPCPQQCL